MKTSSQTPSVNTTNPVEVTISVTKFKDVLTTKGSGRRDTEYRMKLKKSHPQASIKGDDIYIKAPGAVIRFTIASSAADKGKYYPAGISFLRQGARSTSDEQRLGLLNFPQGLTRAEGRSISITDTYKDGSVDVRYKFSVLIQRGSDGKLGIIDPGIVHKNQH